MVASQPPLLEPIIQHRSCHYIVRPRLLDRHCVSCIGFFWQHSPGHGAIAPVVPCRRFPDIAQVSRIVPSHFQELKQILLGLAVIFLDRGFFVWVGGDPKSGS